VPGVVLKLLNKNIELVIIESNNKKIEFLRLLALKLNIQIELKTQRAEEITENDFNRFDYVTSRAVAELRILIEISVPYCKIGGTIIEPKSSKVQEEIENSK
jgi:16S rRNA (guanine527-N7)-methyltransferase